MWFLTPPGPTEGLELGDALIGYIVAPSYANLPDDGRPFGVDNGCYAHPETFDLDAYLAWLKDLPRALFATAEDEVGDARATLAKSMPQLDLIRRTGQPAAFVAQDGLEELPIPWDDFDVLFVGGSTSWKLSPHAAELARQAHDLGKHVHVGRVNSFRRALHAAQHMDADSVDGSYLRFGPKTNLVTLRRWFAATRF